jgi:3-oxoadipate enol-lactonase
MATIEVVSDGCQLHCRVDGPAAGEALLLSNALGTTLDLWEGQVASFAQRHRVIRYDSRGHGRSAAPAGEYTIEQLGRDALAVLDAAGVERAHVCGLSLGGITAMWLALHARHRVTTLVLACTGARIGTEALWEERIRQVRTTGLEGIADGTMARWFTPRFRVAHPDVVATFRRTLASGSPQGYLGCCAALRDADLLGAISRIGAPTLAIAGTSDEATPPANAEMICASIHGARMVTLDAAHLANVEQAQDFNEQVLAVINQRGSTHE